jgi:hypothetical protein
VGQIDSKRTYIMFGGTLSVKAIAPLHARASSMRALVCEKVPYMSGSLELVGYKAYLEGEGKRV